MIMRQEEWVHVPRKASKISQSSPKARLKCKDIFATDNGGKEMDIIAGNGLCSAGIQAPI